ncbi:MAG: hypothetical protein EBV03_12755 [Proteobacteria bacterium]|jgi:hypothetical protein|nr:hypothetical protein [Pseudomonadota bacterium]
MSPPPIPSDPVSHVGGKKKQQRVHNLNDLTVDDLRKRASKKNISGRSSMNKAELVAALRK